MKTYIPCETTTSTHIEKNIIALSCFLPTPKDVIYGTGQSQAERGEEMDLSASDIDRNMRQFVRMAMRVLQNAANKGHNEYRRQAKAITMFSEMPEREIDQLNTTDRYFCADTVFEVLGFDVVVQSPVLADALRQLPEHRRNIILLKYFLKWTDREIGESFAIERATIQYQRKATLKVLERLLKEE